MKELITMQAKIFMSFFLFLSLFRNHSLATSEIDTLFKKGGSSYEEGHYSQAINAYESIIKKGIKNSTIYYNLGNAYFKDNQMGKARLYYERAFRLSPRNEDIRFNLKFSYTKVSKENQKGIFKKLLFNIYSFLNINELTILTSFFYLFLCILTAIYIFRKRAFFLWTIIFTGFVTLLSGLWLFGKIYNEKLITTAIVTVPSGEVRNGPAGDYPIGFTIPEGKKVTILQEKDTWYAIGVKEKGLKGWIKKESIEKI